MNNRRYEELKNADHRHLWHPFTQMRTWLDDEPIVIESGEGNYLIDVNGKRYLDGGIVAVVQRPWASQDRTR